jgi:hypothetical protein
MGRNKTQKKKYGGSPKDDSDNDSIYSLTFEDVRAELADQERTVVYRKLIDKINKEIEFYKGKLTEYQEKITEIKAEKTRTMEKHSGDDKYITKIKYMNEFIETLETKIRKTKVHIEALRHEKRKTERKIKVDASNTQPTYKKNPPPPLIIPSPEPFMREASPPKVPPPSRGVTKKESPSKKNVTKKTTQKETKPRTIYATVKQSLVPRSQQIVPVVEDPLEEYPNHQVRIKSELARQKRQTESVHSQNPNFYQNNNSTKKSKTGPGRVLRYLNTILGGDPTK